MLHILLVIGLTSLATASPVPAVKYDQRQEGEWNVRADLENFVILIIPSSSPGNLGGIGLLDLISKAMPARNHNRKHIKKVPESIPDEPEVDTQAFIESKTAPYHVDISRSRFNLAKLHPTEGANKQKESMLSSPTIALLKSQFQQMRNARTFDASTPLQVEIIEPQISKRIDNVKDKPKYDKFLLIGADEQCGPGYLRDKAAICRPIKNF